MARTQAQLDAAVAALEGWRSSTVDPSLAQARTAIIGLRGDVTALQAFVERVRAVWSVLRTGRIEGIDDGGAIEVQERLSVEDRANLAWLREQRRRASGR